MGVLLSRTARTLDLTNALAAGLSAEALESRNGKARSNTIGGQFWCVVGARESYARALEAGEWRGFSCSLGDTGSPDAVQAALASSRDAVLNTLRALGQPLDDARETILLDLIEHEAQHHGQLIRYFYANEIPFPPAFAARYAL